MQGSQQKQWTPLLADLPMLARALIIIFVTTFMFYLIAAILFTKSSYYQNVIDRAFKDLQYSFNGSISYPIPGLVILLIMDLIAKYHPVLQIDWTLIRSWSRLTLPLQIVTAPFLVIWWSLALLVFVYSICLAIPLLLFGIGIVEKIINTIVHLIEVAIGRLFVIVPYVASKEDAEAIKKKVQELLNELKSKWTKSS